MPLFFIICYKFFKSNISHKKIFCVLNIELNNKFVFDFKQLLMLYKIYNIYIITNVCGLFFSVKYNNFLFHENFLSYQRIHTYIYINH